MKPILLGSTPDGTTEGERATCFGREPGGVTINTAIMANYKDAEFAARLAKCREKKQVALVWFYPDHATIHSLGFHPSLIPDHPDTVAVTNRLREHSAAGGLAICSVLDETEQYAAWGGAVYRSAFDAIVSRFPKGCFAAWTKGPNPAKAPLTFADWKPMLATFRGVNIFADCVDPSTARGFDVLRFLHDPATAGMPTVIMGGGFSAGDIRDPVVARKWVKAFLSIALAEAYDVRVCTAPMNQDFSGFPGIGGCNGRYVAGPHQPPGDKTSAAWPGSPEFCAVLAKAYAVPGQWLFAGDDALNGVLA